MYNRKGEIPNLESQLPLHIFAHCAKKLDPMIVTSFVKGF